MWLDVQASTKKHIRRKLQGEFGESLLIFPDNNGKVIVIPDYLKITTLAGEQVRMKVQLNSLKKGNSDPLQLITRQPFTLELSLRNLKHKQALDNYRNWIRIIFL